MNRIVKLMILLFLTASYPAVAQYHYFKHYLTEDGLAHNTVITLMQDSKGLLWIGTKSGLNRFDGYSFKTYKNEHNSLGMLGNNVILSFVEDRKGMIWIGTERGLFKYNPYKETFTEAPFLIDASFNNLLIDKDDNLWFLAGSDVYYFNMRTNRLKRTGFQASCMIFDSSGDLWTGTRSGLVNRYHDKSHALDSFRIIRPGLPNNRQIVTKLLFASNGEILVGTSKEGLKVLNLVNRQLRSILYRNDDNTEIYVRDIVLVNDHEYWIATETGIYICNINEGRIQHLKKRIGDNYALSDNPVYSLCLDKSGGMWAGTFFGGLNYFSKQNSKFEKYYPLMDKNSISGNAVREIVGDNNNNLWIGTEDAGINKLDLRTKQFTHYTAGGNNGSVSYPNIHGLLAVGSKLYVGPFQHGLEIMDTRTGKITDRFKLFGEKGKMNSDFAMCVYLKRDSSILIGSTGYGAGLYEYNPENKTFSKSKQIPPRSFVYALLEDHTGTIWTGSYKKGTFFFDPRSGKRGNIRFKEMMIGNEAIDYLVQGITEDSDHNLWFMTDGGGLIRLSADRKKMKKFTVRNGLPSNYLFRALEDGHHNLWVSSLKGMICLNTRTEKIRIFTQDNGLLTDQFNYNSAYKDYRGTMYFGSVRGMVAFNPDSIIQDQPAPPIYITGFQVNNKDVVPGAHSSPLNKSITYTDSVILKYNQSSISIEFAALNYSSPNVTRYRYRLVGLDKDWTYLKKNRKAYFTDLSPGDYTFLVSAQSNVGVWRSAERKLFIRVLPPFWKSAIAYIIYALIFLLSLYLLVYYYKLRLEQKNRARLQLFEHEKTKEIYQAKIEFFTNIAHEIQTPLTLIIGPVNLLKKKLEHLSTVKRNFAMIEKNTQRLYELTTQLLDFRKTEIDGFGLNFVGANVTLLLKEQVAHFQVQAAAANIDLTITLPRKHVSAFIDREAFVKIIGNLLSNAIKYADSKATIELHTLQSSATHFTIEVANDGAIIPNDLKGKIFEPFFRIKGTNKQGTGIGLALAKSLSELHNGTLTVKTTDQLNVFLLKLPVHQKIEFTLTT